MFEDRRKQKRVEVSIPIRVKGLDLKGNRFDEVTKSIELSPDGATFALKASIRKGSLLDLALPLPRPMQRNVAPKPVYETVGYVIRVEESAAPQAHKVAVRFRAVGVRQYRSES
jgi:hypothetical protein